MCGTETNLTLPNPATPAFPADVCCCDLHFRFLFSLQPATATRWARRPTPSVTQRAASVSVSRTSTRGAAICATITSSICSRLGAGVSDRFLFSRHKNNGEVQQTRLVLFRRAPIARSVIQMPFGHLPLALSAQLSFLDHYSGNWGTVCVEIYGHAEPPN